MCTLAISSSAHKIPAADDTTAPASASCPLCQDRNKALQLLTVPHVLVFVLALILALVFSSFGTTIWSFLVEKGNSSNALQAENEQLKATIYELEKELSKQKSLVANKSSALDDKDLVPLDRVPLSLGVERSGGVMEVLIGRDTKLPAKAAHTLALPITGYQSAVVRIFEGEHRLTKDNVLLGEFKLYDLPTDLIGEVKVALSFEIGADRILHVKAETATGEKNGITVLDYKNRMFYRHKVEQMVAAACKSRSDDAQLVVQQETKWVEELKHQKKAEEENLKWRRKWMPIIFSGGVAVIMIIGIALGVNTDKTR